MNIPLVDLHAQYLPLKDEIFAGMEKVFESMHLFLGENVQALEKEFAQFCGAQYGIGVSDGTSALQIILRALGIGPGDEVITVSHTFIATAEAIVLAGAKPVFVDIYPDTCLMDVTQVEEKITARTRAIMPVHIYGHPVDMDPLVDLAKKYNLIIIEDAAEAHGAEYKGRKSGGLGDLGCFSFYANKIITTGEGGMVLTRDAAQVERLRALRNLCFRKERRFLHTELGHNYRLTNLQAAIGLAQLERIEESVTKKRWMGAAYTDRLHATAGLQLPIEEPWAKNVNWMYGVVLDNATGMDAVEFARRLAGKGVMTRPFFLGMHEQPVFQSMGLFIDEHYPVAEYIARQGLYLPSGMTLSEAQVDQVCEAVVNVLSRK
jgi:perosamine synthetase